MVKTSKHKAKKEKIPMIAGGLSTVLGTASGILTALGICGFCIAPGIIGGLGLIGMFFGFLFEFNIYFIIIGLAMFLLGFMIRHEHKKDENCKKCTAKKKTIFKSQPLRKLE